MALQAHIQERVYSHLFRHSYATWALNRGTNPITLAQILRHSSLAMTQNAYSHLSPGDTYDATLRALTTTD